MPDRRSRRRRKQDRQAQKKNIFLRMEEERQANEAKGLNFRRRRNHISQQTVKQYVLPVIRIAAVILAAFLIIEGFAVGIRMAGSSMTDTIASGDHILVNRVIYHISSPKAGDVIAFLPPNNKNAQISVKRVVAVPGDTVQIKNGALYVNNSRYEISQASGKISESGLAAEKIKLRSDEYFVLGDNRNNSEDSRYETIGNIHKSEITGKVWFDTTMGHFGNVR